MSLADRVRECREKLNLSQDELAKLVGYNSRMSISSIECGTNTIPYSKLVKFALALHTTTDYLLCVDTEDASNPDALNKDIAYIVRCSKHLTPEQCKTLRVYAETLYPEVFNKN